MEHWNIESNGGIVVAAHHNPPMNYVAAQAMEELKTLVASWQDRKSRRACR